LEFSITAKNGDSVKIEAANWMAAFGKVLPFFTVDLASKLICIPDDAGTVLIETPGTGETWMIRELDPAIRVMASASSERLPSVSPDAPPSAPPSAPPMAAVGLTGPALQMPVQSSLQPEVPVASPSEHEDEEEEETLAERLFDLSFDLTEAEPDEACRLGLNLILEFVPVQAASVARGSLNDSALTFVAATGPVADDIVGRKVKFGAGLIGMCFDMKGTLLTNDVRRDSRHLDSLDAKTGFESQVALCVPLLDDSSESFGVIQLLNPVAGSFQDVDVEAVEAIAKTLAGALSAHYAGVTA
jgi:hypothetical protein